jgi:hypothetical protein
MLLQTDIKFGLLWPTCTQPLHLYIYALSEKHYHRQKDSSAFNTQLCPLPFSLMHCLKAFPQIERGEREGERGKGLNLFCAQKMFPQTDIKFGLLWPTSFLPLYLYLNALSEKCYHRQKNLLAYYTQLCPSPFSLIHHLKVFPQTH